MSYAKKLLRRKATVLKMMLCDKHAIVLFSLELF